MSTYFVFLVPLENEGILQVVENAKAFASGDFCEAFNKGF
jgi:hypothetical protein